MRCIRPAGFSSPPTAPHTTPVCRRVPATAESRGWGELTEVDQAVARLRAGGTVDSIRRGVLPGPEASGLCRHCVAGIGI